MPETAKIAIVGAGIGGLALVSMLADQGHQVTVYDQFEAPKPVGSGLIIQPIGQAVLDCVGAGEAARAKGNRLHRMLGHAAPADRPVLDVFYDKPKRQQTGLAIHRASPELGQGANMALLDALALARAVSLVGPDKAPRLYARSRRAHVWTYQTVSAMFTPQYQSDSTILPVVRDRVLFPVSQIWPVTRILTQLVRGRLLPPMGRLTHVGTPRRNEV